MIILHIQNECVVFDTMCVILKLYKTNWYVIGRIKLIYFNTSGSSFKKIIIRKCKNVLLKMVSRFVINWFIRHFWWKINENAYELLISIFCFWVMNLVCFIIERDERVNWYRNNLFIFWKLFYKMRWRIFKNSFKSKWINEIR